MKTRTCRWLRRVLHVYFFIANGDIRSAAISFLALGRSAAGHGRLSVGAFVALQNAFSLNRIKVEGGAPCSHGASNFAFCEGHGDSTLAVGGEVSSWVLHVARSVDRIRHSLAAIDAAESVFGVVRFFNSVQSDWKFHAEFAVAVVASKAVAPVAPFCVDA